MEEFLKKLDLLPEDARFILIMTVVFALFWKFVSKDVMQKFLDLYEAREKSTTGATSDAEENLLTSQKLLEECEKTLVSERAAALKALEPTVNSSKAEAAKIIAQAEDLAHAATQKTRDELAIENTQMFSTLEARSDELAKDIAQQALN